VVGGDERSQLGVTRQRILEHLDHGGTATAGDVALALDVSLEAARQALKQMADAGQVLRVERGLYSRS
jgi:predicted ArsR family transcriptional regulator